MRLTDEELHALLDAEAKATPGEWRTHQGGLHDIHGGDGTHLFRSVRRDLCGAPYIEQDANTALIVAARNSLREIVEELVERREIMRKDCSFTRAEMDESERLYRESEAEPLTNAEIESIVDAQKRIHALEAENERLREANESVAVCKDHTSDVIGDHCVVCENERLREALYVSRDSLGAVPYMLGESGPYLDLGDGTERYGLGWVIDVIAGYDRADRTLGKEPDATEQETGTDDDTNHADS